ADTIPEEQPLRDAIAGAAQDGVLHLPYTRYRALSPAGTLAVYARGVDPLHAPVTEESMRPIGGVWVISAEAYWRAGGMDEKFRGWGVEDDAFWTASSCLLGEPVRHTGAITHLHHEPAADVRSPEYRANQQRYRQYQAVRRNPEKMRRLVGLPEEPRPLRVVAVVHYYPPAHRAGAELMLHALLRALAERGHQVEVWATDEETDAEVDGIRVHAGTPRRVRADVVVSHLKSVPLARRLARVAGARLVQVLHSAAPWIGAEAAKGAALFVANTEHVAVALRPRMRGKHVVVHPPVWAEEHATTPGECVTLVNPLPAKGAEVFYQLAERFPDVRFLAVEGGYQRPEQIRRDLPNVEWQPHTGDMRNDVWARTRVLLMPSVEESYGMCAVEAAASGIPTIAHPTDGLKEALGDAGTYVDRDDIDAWEQALRPLLGRGWKNASRKASARSAELDPRGELDAWVQAIESR